MNITILHLMVFLLLSQSCQKEKTRKKPQDRPFLPTLNDAPIKQTYPKNRQIDTTAPEPEEKDQPSGKETEEAVTFHLPTTMNHQDSLRVRFSRPLRLEQLAASLKLTQNGLLVPYDTMPIVSDRYMDLKPKRLLLEGIPLKVQIENDSENGPFSGSVYVRKTSRYSIRVLGHNPKEGPILIPRNQEDKVLVTFDDYRGEDLLKVELRRLGSGQKTLLCQQKDCQKIESLVPMDFEDGLNLFELIMVSKLTPKAPQTQLFSFAYGPVASQHEKAGMIENALNTFVDQKTGIDTFATLLQTFTSQRYKLKYMVDGKEKALYFDDVMNKLTEDITDEEAKKRRKAEGLNCMLDGDNVSLPKEHQFAYLTAIGPFCGIDVDFRYEMSSLIPHLRPVRIKGKADLYFEQFPSIHDPEGSNTKVKFTALADNLFDSSLEARSFKGKYRIVVKISSVEFIPKCRGIQCLSERSFDLLEGTYIYKGDFEMDEPDHQYSTARSTIGFTKKGEMTFSLNGFDDYDFLSTNNTYKTDVSDTLNFARYIVTDWSNSAKIGTPSFITKLEKTGIDHLTGPMTEEAVFQAMNHMKPLATNLMLSDLVGRVSPDIVNRILTEFRRGARLKLPPWSPSPLNELTLRVGAQMGTDVRSLKPKNGKKGGLKGKTLAYAVVDEATPAMTPPKGLQGIDSFIKSRTKGPPPSPVHRYREALPGLLFTIKKDVINQGLYHTWKSGYGAIRIDKPFASRFKDAAGDKRLSDIVDHILKPKIIMAMLDPDRISYYNKDFEPLKIDDHAKITLNIESYAPLDVAIEPIKEGFSLPRTRVSGQLKLTIAMQKPGESPIKIITAIIHGRTFAKVSFLKGQNQSNPDHGDLSFSLHLSKDPKDFSFAIEIPKSPNPFSLDTRKVRAALNGNSGLITDLFVPLINQVMERVPLPPLKSCGILIENISFLKVTHGDRAPFLLARVPIGNYDFRGECDL